ncbi:MAG: hypothetical protein JXC32_14485 [Anaerolineae bacterium]|nr:hypothetical protein [Anaerolineae bacterium]
MCDASTYRLSIVLIIVLVISLGACATPAPQVVRVEVTATPTSGPSPTPLPTWTPTPTPTATPIPPAQVKALVPDVVSPLEPVAIEAVFVPPPGVSAGARLSATVMDPAAAVYAIFELSEREGDRYRSPEVLQLPLEPLGGYWWLIVHAETQLPVEGMPARFFEVAPVTYRSLTGTLPSGVNLRVPVDFLEVVAVGDQTAGGRAWQYGEGEVALWWAPGPAEALLLNSAVVALEATYTSDERFSAFPQPVEVVETAWQGHPAFQFPEQWPGPEGGPALAWVIQDPSAWLYILRVRAVGTDSVPELHRQIAETFSIVLEAD